MARKDTRSLFQQVFLASGSLAPLLFGGLVLAAASQNPGYSHLTQAISELAATDAPSPWLQTENFLITGALITLFGIALSRSSGSWWSGLFTVLFGVGIVIQGLAPCDTGCNFVTTTGAVHNVVGLAGFVAAIAAIWLQGSRAPHGVYRRYSRASGVAGMVSFVLWIGVGKIAAVPAANGSLQRVFVGILLLWCAITAMRELRQLRARETAADVRSGTRSMPTAARRVASAVVLLVTVPSVVAAQETAVQNGTSFMPGSTASVFAFLLVVSFVIGAYIWGTFVAARRDADAAAAPRITWRFVMGLALWLGAFNAWVGSGVIQTRPIPFGPLTFLAVCTAAIAFALSSSGARLARHIPLVALVAFQGFRLPLELVLHAWSQQGTIPEAMTWSGSNFDIVTGVLALVLAPFAGRRSVAWIVNVVGLVLLANVGRVAVMTSPVPFGWDVQPKLMLVAYLPYAYVGAVCVAGALAGHVILTRRLLGRC